MKKTDKSILDPCSGSRMFYFDKSDERVLFGDIRHLDATLTDSKAPGGVRELHVHPDIEMDFRALPFPSRYRLPFTKDSVMVPDMTGAKGKPAPGTGARPPDLGEGVYPEGEKAADTLYPQGSRRRRLDGRRLDVIQNLKPIYSRYEN